jgi:para-nitrobenzyl esterase
LFNLPVTVPRPPLNAQQLALSSTMQHYWTNFAKTGTPNGAGLAAWEKFNAAVGNFQSLIPPTPGQETTFATNHKCAFWAALLAAQ